MCSSISPHIDPSELIYSLITATILLNMGFLADFHIHSRFSIATSKESDPEHLLMWACIKGITVLGTGDFTHPGWFEELTKKLVPAEDGLFKIRDEYEKAILGQIPNSCHNDVRFILSAEISSIYKKGGKTRKVHNCLLVPTFEEASAIARRLERIGNIHSDGRPILGLDSRDLLEIMLEHSPSGIFIPAHIWTPHFSVLGAYSGFDSVTECFDDLSEHIFALETGLSSDPAMNWRLSSLDRYTLVSNSDAHSPMNLAREANILDCELSFPAIRSAIKEKDREKFLGTVEFFPEEGKYHFNGHRNCSIRMEPEETLKVKGVCPKCGKQMTLGVMHRVVELADRPPGFVPPGAPPFKSLIPLPEILADYLSCSKSSKKTLAAYFNLIHRFGPEWHILHHLPVEELERYTCPSLAAGIKRMREGKVSIKPGFDGEYGAVSLFLPEERGGKGLQISLLGKKEAPLSVLSEYPHPVSPEESAIKASSKTLDLQNGSLKEIQGPEDLTIKKFSETGVPEEQRIEMREKNAPYRYRCAAIESESLNPEQIHAVQAFPGPILVIAGPGTGKTRTLVHRIALLIHEKGVPGEQILAITFTNKAAQEMKGRLASLLKMGSNSLPTPLFPFIGTFHQFCLDILRKYGGNPHFILFHTHDSLGVIDTLLREKKGKSTNKSREYLLAISRMKMKPPCPQVSDKGHENLPPFSQEENYLPVYQKYQEALLTYNAYDYDDLLIKTVELLKSDEALLSALRKRYTHIVVDEFQDVNVLQFDLVKLLSGRGEGLFVIGDPNQAIYGFRGADTAFFSQLTEEYPSARTCTLDANYRTTRPILHSAVHLISHNPAHQSLQLTAMRGDGLPIQIMEFSSEKAEGIAIVKKITTLIGGIDMLQAHGERIQASKETTYNLQRGYSFSDFAILFRTGSQADVLEECLKKEGIPYQVVGNQGILENPLARQILSLLRWSRHPDDAYSLRHTLTLPLFHFSGKEREDIMGWLKKGDDLTDPSLSMKMETLLAYSQRARESTPSQFIQHIIADLFVNEETEIHRKDIERLALLAEEFNDVASLLDSVRLHREGDISWKGLQNKRGIEMVKLMTLHAAKGLEFPVIFICGCEEGILPHFLSAGEEDALAEERRLFYVGMTRAKDQLFLTCARSRVWHGTRQDRTSSPFLKELPEMFYKKATTLSPPSPQKSRTKQLSLW